MRTNRTGRDMWWNTKELTQVGETILNSMRDKPEEWAILHQYRYDKPSLTYIYNERIGVKVYLSSSLLYWYDCVWMDTGKRYPDTKCLYPERINSFDHKKIVEQAWALYEENCRKKKQEERDRENARLGIVEVVKL